MLFTFKVTAPANTPQASPAKTSLKLRSGVITKISVLIPPGHVALAHMAIFHGETQIMPWGDGQWLEGEGETVEWTPDYELTSEPAELEGRAWNEDDMYPHSFYVRVWVDPGRSRPDWALLEKGSMAIAQFVKRVMGE